MLHDRILRMMLSRLGLFWQVGKAEVTDDAANLFMLGGRWLVYEFIYAPTLTFGYCSEPDFEPLGPCGTASEGILRAVLAKATSLSGV